MKPIPKDERPQFAIGERQGVYEILLYLRDAPPTKSGGGGHVYLAKCTKCGNMREVTHSHLLRVALGSECKACRERLSEAFLKSMKPGATLTGLKLLWRDDTGTWMTECRRCGSGVTATETMLLRRRKLKEVKCANCRSPTQNRRSEPAMRLLASVHGSERLWDESSRKLAEMGLSRPSNR